MTNGHPSSGVSPRDDQPGGSGGPSGTPFTLMPTGTEGLALPGRATPGIVSSPTGWPAAEPGQAVCAGSQWTFSPALALLSFSFSWQVSEKQQQQQRLPETGGRGGQRARRCSGPALTRPLALVSQLQAQKLRLAFTRSCRYGGSLPDVNQIGCGLAELQVSGRRPRPARLGSFGADSPVCFGRAPSTHRRIRPGALGTTGWWSGCSETPGGWRRHSAATPATYPSRGRGRLGRRAEAPPELTAGRVFKCPPAPSVSRGFSPLPPPR